MSDRTRSASALPLILLGIGLLGVVATWFSGGAMRFAANWIAWYMIGLSVLLGSLFIIALEHLVGARWSIPLRRVPERITTLIGPLFVIGLVAAVLGATRFYEWGTDEFMAMAAADHHLHAKHLWFSKPFFFGRLLFSFAIWAIAYRIFVQGSFAQDQSRDPRQNLRARSFAPGFMFLFAITLSLAAFDFLMSVEPRWYSTIFGVYYFAVCVLTAVSVIVLLVLRQIRLGRLPQVRPDHIYSLGGLLFAFTVFWTYISFSQFMLYWYGNLPFEIFWYPRPPAGRLVLAYGRAVRCPFRGALLRPAQPRIQNRCETPGLGGQVDHRLDHGGCLLGAVPDPGPDVRTRRHGLRLAGDQLLPVLPRPWHRIAAAQHGAGRGHARRGCQSENRAGVPPLDRLLAGITG
jgi:hypothetical protein